MKIFIMQRFNPPSPITGDVLFHKKTDDCPLCVSFNLSSLVIFKG